MKSVFRLFAYFFLGFLAASCQQSHVSPQEAAKWIEAYSPEEIDVASPVRLVVTDSLRSRLNSTTELSCVFSFSPSIKGEAKMSANRQYIDFVPAPGAMKQGRSYTCKIDMAQLTRVDSLGLFQFDFRATKREMKFMEVKTAVDANNVEQLTVEGRVKTNIPLTAEMLKKAVVKCNDASAVSTLSPTAEKCVYAFRITNIARKTKDTKTTIVCNPSSGFASKSITLPVPGLAEFKLLSAKLVDDDEAYIEMRFSEPLDNEQELDGLITVDSISQLRFHRNGAVIKAYCDHEGMPTVGLHVTDMVRSARGRRLNTAVEEQLQHEVLPPAVEIPLHGNILPNQSSLTLPFRAVNLAAVDVEVVKVYSDNVMSFMQMYDLEETDYLRYYGRIIYRQTVRLDTDKRLNLHRWQNFSVDLKNLFHADPRAIYNIRIAFRKAYSLYRQSPKDIALAHGLTATDEEEWADGFVYFGRNAPDYNWERYDWNEDDDPAKDSYYMRGSRMPEYNLMASNLALMAKKGVANEYACTVTDINSALPLSGIKVKAYNLQLQPIGSGTTNANGHALIKCNGKPLFITASDAKHTTYLKINNATALNFGVFPTEGHTNTDGIKGYVYGDRGVWRPGDDIHLTLVVEDKRRALPQNHPVTMELFTPNGTLYDRQILTKSTGGMYVFHTRTTDDATTGRWEAHFKVGPNTFEKLVRIETIKPNRLKINVALPKVIQAGRKSQVVVSSQWLTGAVAANLSAKLEMELFANPKPFEKFGDYVFSNPLVDFNNEKHNILSARLDSAGRVSKVIDMPATAETAGMLQANINARVMESSGDESVVSRSVPYSPYASYVGIKLGDSHFTTDKDIRLPVVCVGMNGAPLHDKTLEYKILKLDWDWWHEGSTYDLQRYMKSSSVQLVSSGMLKTVNGHGTVPFRVNYPEWGRYLILVSQQDGKHITGGTISVDWPEWRGHSDKSEPTAEKLISVSLDKKNYEAGDVATVFLPAVSGGRVLLSVENGSGIVAQEWVALNAKTETKHNIKVTKAMAPNFYITASMIVPHRLAVDGEPIRRYGVCGADVIDRSTILHPEIIMPDELRPQQEFTVRVRERDNKPMTYTLAIVDEGLLDISSFKTPNPWPAMYVHEALGVRTWDMFDDVVGALSTRFTPVLTIGGDEALRQSAGKEKRFRPVVRFLGPFTLKGGSTTHRLSLPMYVGSVRVMVVAAHDGNYGSADKTVAVNSPLMLLPTLPRTLMCGDRVQLPVNLFTSKGCKGNVKVSVKTEGPLQIVGSAEQTVAMATDAEALSRFTLQCDKARSGVAKVIVNATCMQHKAVDTVYIEVKNRLPIVATQQSVSIAKGSSHTFSWSANGVEKVGVELATIPSINFSGVFSFVDSYAHECTEQLSSRAMYLLYARKFLGESEQAKAEKLLPQVLKTILSRQLTDGGFAYWPGNSTAHPWVTSMAGEVLIEAKRQKFAVDAGVLKRWNEYQTQTARQYVHSTLQCADLIQAYRLYTLALNGSPSAADMNRLREASTISRQALLRLAAAYAVAGRTDVATKMLAKEGDKTDVSGGYNTFYSPLRDKAMELEAWLLAGQTAKATALARSVAKQFSPFCSTTQEVGFVSVAMSRLAEVAGARGNDIVVSQPQHSPLLLHNMRGVKTIVPDVASKSITVANNGNVPLDASISVVRRLTPAEAAKAVAKGVAINVVYTDMKGKRINTTSLQQGDEFVATVSVSNYATSTQSMALTLNLPSGWEINNSLADRAAANNTPNVRADYRDDCVRWYFPLSKQRKTTFKVRLRAAWCGVYTIPSAVCEDMYAPQNHATTAAQNTEVRSAQYTK